MSNQVIEIYDQDANPNEQDLADDTYSRSPAVIDNVLWCGTAAIPDGSTYRFELRTTGQIPTYGIELFPSPTPVIAFLLNDGTAFISAIVGHPGGAVLFALKAAAAADTAIYEYATPDLSVDDAPGIAATLPLLGVLGEEIVATYDDNIRIRDRTGVWAAATVTPAPTSYKVKGVHSFLGALYFLTDANYSGTEKAEVWKYTGNGAAVTLDQSYSGTTRGSWNASYVAGGLFSGGLYACWNDTDTTHTIVKRDASAWSNVKTGVQVGELAEFRGSIYGHYAGTLLSPGADPTGTWATISASFPGDLIPF